MPVKRQFWLSFTSLFILAYLPFIYSFLFINTPKILTLGPPTENSIYFTISPDPPLQPETEFKLSIHYSVNQPVHFIQSSLKLDPDILEPILPIEKKHSLPFHKANLSDNKTVLKIAAFGIDPKNITTKLSDSATGTNKLAEANFKLKPTTDSSTEIKLLLNKTLDDWDASNLVYLDSSLNPYNLLETPVSFTIPINQSTPSPSLSPLTSPSPSIDPNPSASPSSSLISSSSAELFDYLAMFPTIATEASEIKEATPSSTAAELITHLKNPQESTSSTNLSSPAPETEPVPVNQVPQPTLIQKLIGLISKIFTYLGSLTLNRS